MSRLLLAGALLVCSLSAQLPSFYNEVDSLVWVVEDLDQTLKAWQPSGVLHIAERIDLSVDSEYRGRPGSFHDRGAIGAIGNVRVHWVEPRGGDDNAFSAWRKQHGSGVMALLHRVPGTAELEAEIARMKGLGVAVLQRGPVDGEGGQYVLFDTEPKGKYVLGLVHYGAAPHGPPAGARRVTQYAFMVRDHDGVSAYWASLGWPALTVTQSSSRDLEYKGKPAQFSSALGWQRHGKVVYEWILPKQGPSAWHDHLNAHGESVHHIAFNVPDIDAAIAEWNKAGFIYTMGGAWGEAGKKGSGRFAYVRAPAGGLDIEFLWNQP